MKTGNSYKDGFLALAEEYRRLLWEEGMAFVERLATEKSVCEVMVTVYGILKGEGRLVPLEELDGKEKQELWAEAVRLLPGGDREARVRLCKAIHALGTWCQIMDET